MSATLLKPLYRDEMSQLEKNITNVREKTTVEENVINVAINIVVTLNSEGNDWEKAKERWNDLRELDYDRHGSSKKIIFDLWKSNSQNQRYLIYIFF